MGFVTVQSAKYKGDYREVSLSLGGLLGLNPILPGHVHGDRKVIPPPSLHPLTQTGIESQGPIHVTKNV